MKFRKKVISIVLTLMMALNLATVASIPTFAHETMLNVDYDRCIADPTGDGGDEMWYALVKDAECRHISHEVDTIKYYFADYLDGSTYTWTTDVSSSVAKQIKQAYANSMKKWNNVYFYSCDEYGILTKHKIINVVEGTEDDHNLIIYPVDRGESIATTGPVGNVHEIESGETRHLHYSKWKMTVSVDRFYVNSGHNQSYVDAVRERTGAHELGHVLGLRDVELNNLCGAVNTTQQHHQELLMGYGSTIESRGADISYKDIAGAAIARGFHTDNDHKWLNCGMQIDGTYKLICSICNGVKCVDSLNGYTYKTYGACGNNHTLSEGNMMAVASYGTKDYYKCEYCRYVAPFASIVEQDYSAVYHNDVYHQYVNQVDGLEYAFFEEHVHDIYVNLNETSHQRRCECGTNVQEEHVYDICVYLNEDSHQTRCACGAIGGTSRHTLSISNVTPGVYFAPCMGCGFLLDMRGDMYETIMSITQVSINGSYVLPSGIIVLVDEDIQAYWDGTLVFYHPDDLPVTQ